MRSKKYTGGNNEQSLVRGLYAWQWHTDLKIEEVFDKYPQQPLYSGCVSGSRQTMKCLQCSKDEGMHSRQWFI